MAKPYSEDLRGRVVGAGQDGATIPETAEQLGVSISSVVRFRRLHRETGSVSPAKFGGYKGYALAAHEELVRRSTGAGYPRFAKYFIHGRRPLAVSYTH